MTRSRKLALLALAAALVSPPTAGALGQPPGPEPQAAGAAQTAPAAETDRKIPESYLRDPSRPILVMFTASWCGPCRMMKTQTLPHPDVAPLLERVNLLMMDIDTAEGKKFQALLGKERVGIPNFVLMDSRQRVVASSLGYTKPQPFIEFLGKVLTPQTTQE